MVNPYQGNREQLNGNEYGNRVGGHPGVQQSHSSRPYQPAQVGREVLNPHANEIRSVAYKPQSQRAPDGREQLNPFENADRGVIHRPVAAQSPVKYVDSWAYDQENAYLPPYNPHHIPAIQRRSATDNKISKYVIALIFGCIIAVASSFSPIGIGFACFTTTLMIHRIRKEELHAQRMAELM